jgi:ABC-2 type transport system permease protein
MVNVIFEIARKEVTSYYARKGIIMQNALLAVIFCLVPVQQIGSMLAASGYRASAFSGMLEFYLLFATLYPIVIASGISVFAFPVERDQKTIEHLLSLPLANGQIFLGKALAAIATAIVWAAIMFTVILGYTLYANVDSIVWDAPLFTPSLLVMLFAIVPVIILLSTLMTVALTSYISNTRGAYMINVIIMGIMIGVTGVRSEILVDPMLFNLGLLGFLLVLLAATYILSVKSFNREKLIAKT